MAASIPIQTIHNPFLRNSPFLRKTAPTHLSSCPSPSPRVTFMPSAKFQLSELLGGRGLCNGEEGLQKELGRTVQEIPSPSPQSEPADSPSPLSVSSSSDTGDEAFEKELSGLTGGFPGGEKGLLRFIEENPPPKKQNGAGEEMGVVLSGSKPKPPELPLLMPGMIVIVKNPANPFHMYCGIVQRVTDGRAAVLFEGGNWDKLLTFQLDELERREKGPPMVNPKSAILESLVDKSP